MQVGSKTHLKRMGFVLVIVVASVIIGRMVFTPGGFGRYGHYRTGAIDGNTNGLWSGRSVCHTRREREPWWEVDLGSTQPIERIVIWNRTDGGLQARLVPCRVSVLDAAGRVLWQRMITDPPDPNVELHLSPVSVAFRDMPTELCPAKDPVIAGDSGPSPRKAAKSLQRRLVALFETSNPVGFEAGTILTVQLALPAGRGAVIERIRLSATTMPPPLYDVPPVIERIVSTDAARRRPSEARTLAAFYRAIAPALQPVRQRLSRLEGELRQVVERYGAKVR
ncbi:MAG TPA: discoidin domain-containing protein [Planctomycetaceae bacterium]|nr:discoidin domain-containing protein [Planctomycetaceae bacterium]